MSNLTIRVTDSRGGSGRSTTASALAERARAAGQTVVMVNVGTRDKRYRSFVGKLPNG